MVPIKIREKRKPHYNLGELKRLIKQGKWIVTTSADKNIVKLSLTRYEVREILLDLRSKDFYKSMTSMRDYKLWQDVYKPKVSIGEQDIELYVKLQKSADGKCVVISFKKSGG